MDDKTTQDELVMFDHHAEEAKDDKDTDQPEAAGLEDDETPSGEALLGDGDPSQQDAANGEASMSDQTESEESSSSASETAMSSDHESSGEPETAGSETSTSPTEEAAVESEVKGSDCEPPAEPEPVQTDTQDPAGESPADPKPADGQATDALAETADEMQPLLDASAPVTDVDSGSPEPAPTDKAKLPPVAKSRAREDWEYQKAQWGASGAALDSLIDMVGLEAVKARFVEINTLLNTRSRQKTQLSAEDQKNLDSSRLKLGAIFIGNPGTGKKTVAKLYSSFLFSLGLIPKDNLVRTTGSRLATLGASEFQEVLTKVEDGGMLLIDDAHQLIQPGQSSLLDLIISEMETKADKVTLIFAGYGKTMESLTGLSPALPSLVPTTLRFPDYEDDELWELFVRDLLRRFGDNMGLQQERFARIVVTRIGRGRGRIGFGNARDVHAALDRILARQANRLFRQIKAGSPASDLVLTQEDLIGLPPSTIFDTSRAWKELSSMIGLQSVKDSLEALVYRLQVNFERELAGLPLVACSLNKLFLGNPGTGKTTVAKLYGQILAEIGLLSNGEVVVKTPSDFIGDALGASEQNTRAILEATKGKVLIIDEAYMLGGSDDRYVGGIDSYRAAVVDTIVGEVQSTAAEDRCVLLLGYKDRMESMLNNVNPALARRFPLASAFVFEDYSDDELQRILDRQLGRQGFRVTDDARAAALEVLKRARQRVGFGNAGEVDILLDRAKLSQHQRLLKHPGGSGADMLVAADIEEGWDRAIKSEGSVDKHFEDFVGCEALIGRLRRCQTVVKNMKSRGKDPRELIPFNFLFCGPPGTGKTTTAKRMGKIFYEMGFLATPEVMDRSATHLIGEYVGHTGPKTTKLFDSALGRVLFIDEAYRLSEGSYAREAVVEMINLLDSEKYRKKLVVILAGYKKDIHRLMGTNPGFTSRFPEVINFDPLTPDQCAQLLFKRMAALEIDTRELEQSTPLFNFLKIHFGKVSRLPFWGNGRDVGTLASSIRFRLMETNDAAPAPSVVEDIIMDEIIAMSSERQARSVYMRGEEPTSQEHHHEPPAPDRPAIMAPSPPPPPQPKIKILVKKKIEANAEPPEPAKEAPAEKAKAAREGSSGTDDCEAFSDEADVSESDEPSTGRAKRDKGVSDEVWEQLQRDKQAPKKQRAEIRKLSAGVRKLEKVAARYQSKAARAAKSGRTSDLEHLARVMIELQSKLAKQKQELAAKEEKARKEKKEMDELTELGPCPMGYKWVRQEAGSYRCEGGSHYGTFDELMNGKYGKYNPYYNSGYSS